MNNNIKRLEILSRAEIKELYSLPKFNHVDREDFFSLDKEVKKFVFGLRRIETRIYFILLLGYFRSKPLAHVFSTEEIESDLKFVLDKHFNGKNIIEFNITPAAKTKLMNRLLIHTGFVRYHVGKHKKNLLERLNYIAKINIDPRYLFDECIAFFSQYQIILPGYTTIIDLISNIIVNERSRIKNIINTKLSSRARSTILGLLNAEQTFTDLSKLKKRGSDFSIGEIKRELKTHQKIGSIFEELKVIKKHLKLSGKNLEYYALLVRLKSVYVLKRQSSEQTILYLICYLYFRYQETNDNLVSSLIYLTRKLHEASKKYARKRIVEDINVIRKELKVAGELLSFFIDQGIKNETSFGKVRKKAFKLLSKKKIILLRNHLTNTDYDSHHYEWEHIDKNIRLITNTIRSIYLTIDIEFNHLKPALAEQYKLAKDELITSQSIKTVNLDLVNKNEQRFVKDHDNHTHRYEYFLYRKAYQLFNKESLTVTNSINNKSLSSDLIELEKWKANKNKIIKNTGQVNISTAISTTLKLRMDTLNSKIDSVSKTILIGDNKYVEFMPGKNTLKWSIPYRRWQDSIDNPIYRQIKHLGIVELISFVNQKTGFLKAFKHVSVSKEKNNVLDNDLIACILANATNFGLYKMANISDRSVGKLRKVEDAYLRGLTLKDSNDIISNSIAGLPVFNFYNISDNDLFSSIDGQKFECRINTFKARYSSKDFFKGKGVSALTLVSNHVPVNAMVIGSNEYEGHFAFDLLYNNTSEINPNILSTDTHGTNNVNFAILDFFGYKFAPRYARVKKIFFDLFEVMEDENDMPYIKLKKDINVALIESEWESIQHILCSLSEKTASQSTIIRKLSKGSNRTLSALHEYDRLIKSIYILEFVDSAELRHYVQQALNRGEAYHQLRRAVASVNGNKFRGGNDYQVALWNDCARLVSNCIIYYNSSLLSTFLKISQDKGKDELVNYIAQLSPVAWQHINLNGEYSFSQKKVDIDMELLLNSIEELK